MMTTTISGGDGTSSHVVLLSTLVSYGLFGVSILVSNYFHDKVASNHEESKRLCRLEMDEKELDNTFEANEDLKAVNRVALMEWYLQRRSQDRLSFQNLQGLTDGMDTHDEFSSDDDGETASSIGSPGRESNESKTKSFFASLFQRNFDHFEAHPESTDRAGENEHENLLKEKKHQQSAHREQRLQKTKTSQNAESRRGFDSQLQPKKKFIRQKSSSLSNSNLDNLLEGEDLRKGCTDDGDSCSSDDQDDLIGGDDNMKSNNNSNRRQMKDDKDEKQWYKASKLSSGKQAGPLHSTFPSTSLTTVLDSGSSLRKPDLNDKLATFRSRRQQQQTSMLTATWGSGSTASNRTFHRSASLDARSSDHIKRNYRTVGPGSSASSAKDSQLLSLFEKRNSSSPNLEELESMSTATTQKRYSNHSNSEEYYDIIDMLRFQSRAARVNYNARIMPNRVILIRHGQSLGNTNELLYSTTADNAMPLTRLGWEQANAAGKFLKELFSSNIDNTSVGSLSGDGTNNGGVHFVLSPYVRTVETFYGIAAEWCNPSEFQHIEDPDKRLAAWHARLAELGLTWHEDPRIREQDFGNYQEPEIIRKAKKDRHRFGAFYYRFPRGESASDVYDRVSTFLDSLWRSFETNRSRNYVLVTHGISIRIILARYFRYTIDQFHQLANPRNCEMVVLVHDGAGRLELGGRYELECSTNNNSNSEPTQNGGTVPGATGYRYHKRLRVLPRRAVRKVEIRMCYEDDKSTK